MQRVCLLVAMVGLLAGCKSSKPSTRYMGHGLFSMPHPGDSDIESPRGSIVVKRYIDADRYLVERVVLPSIAAAHTDARATFASFVADPSKPFGYIYLIARFADIRAATGVYGLEVLTFHTHETAFYGAEEIERFRQDYPFESQWVLGMLPDPDQWVPVDTSVDD